MPRLKGALTKAQAAAEAEAVEQRLAQRAVNAERTAAAARIEARNLKAEVSAAQTEIARLRLELASFGGGPVQHPAWLVENREEQHHGIVLSELSDCHIGEVVSLEEMNGYNQFNLKIAQLRMRRFFENQIMLTRQYLKGLTYDGAVIAVAGDIVSGGIHDELRETDECSVYEACEYAVDWIGQGINLLGAEFGKVALYFVPGNHGRYGGQRHVPAKKTSASNADSHIGRLLRRDFRDNPDVTINVATGISLDFAVYRTRFRLEHLYPAKGGTGIAGALSPLLLRLHRQRRVADAEGTPFDILMGGHFHQYIMMASQGLIVNGALKGYDEYARASAFSPEPPQQAFMVVTPERGVTFPAPLFVGNRAEEGW